MQILKGVEQKPYRRERRSAERIAIARLDPKKLIRRYCRKNDNQAFSSFYNQQAARLWRFLVARGCDTETAYDILSEAFLRFTQTICKDPSSPVALLYRIAINLNIDQYRRRHASPEVSDGEHIDLIDGIPVSQMNDEHEHLRFLLKTLSSDEQNLLLMRYWLGLTHREVAQALGIPAGTVRRKCANILKILENKWNY